MPLSKNANPTSQNSPGDLNMTQSSLQLWWMAVRPKTLMAAIAPVFMGTALAFGDGVYHLPTAALCLLGALLIQVGTNLSNDYFDFKKGTDDADRIGPTRVTQAGLVKPETVKQAFVLTFVVSALVCAALVVRGGWPILVIGILSIISGLLYTAGPKPLGYLGLGEVFCVCVFRTGGRSGDILRAVV